MVLESLIFVSYVST